MNLFKLLAISVSLIILMAFSIHAINFSHVHPDGVFSQGLEGVLHAMDRKMIFILFFNVLSFLIVSFAKFVFGSRSKPLSFNRIFSREKYKVLPPLLISFKKGILHSQIY